MILEILKIFDYNWFSNHLLYFSGIILLVVIYLFSKLLIKTNKEIKRLDKKSRDNIINMLRNTSKDKEK